MDTTISHVRRNHGSDLWVLVAASVFAGHAPLFIAALSKIGDSSAEKVAQLVNFAYSDFEVVNKPGPADRLFGEVLLRLIVDNFHCYLADVLRLVFLTDPRTLRSSDRVEVEEVLDCVSIEEFASRMAERKTDELSYKGFSSIVGFISDRLGVEMDTEANHFRLATEAIAARNLVVHNRCRANERFIRVTGRKRFETG
jgi:hypothetical protein